MTSPEIAEPLCLYDFDVPVQGVGAIVITSAERARDLKQRPAYVAGYGQNSGHRPTTDQDPREDYLQNNLVDNIWAMSGLSAKDVKVAQFFDEVSPSVVYWLEAAGICKPGEGFEFIQSGNAELGGSLPINTSGGQIGEGTSHGMGQIIEAVVQVMGRAGPRQVPDVHASLITEGSPMSWGAGLLFTDEP
jgi:acetyl-CoA acetyltransferase